jgi:hypothetical protein
MNLEHNATITLDTTAADEAKAERILNGLRGHSPAIGWLPDGRMDVTVTVAGEGLVDAASTAPWEFGVIATDLQGAISWELADDFRSDVHPPVRRTTTHGRQQQFARTSNQRRLPWSAGW